MPLDLTQSEFPIADEEEAFEPPTQQDDKGSSLLGAMKQAGRFMVKGANRVAHKPALAAAMIAAGAALVAPHEAKAQGSTNTFTTYEYTGNPFNTAYCQTNLEYRYGSCVQGNITAVVILENAPENYSGSASFATYLMMTAPNAGLTSIGGNNPVTHVAFGNPYGFGQTIVNSSITCAFAGVGAIVTNGCSAFASGEIYDWADNGNALLVGTNLNTPGTWTLVAMGQSFNSAGALIPNALGDPTDRPGGCGCGDPINISNGNVYENVLDYKTSGTNALSFTRYYNSQQVAANPGTPATTLGSGWRSTFDRYLNAESPTSVTAERADGQLLTFTLQGSTWTPTTDVDYSLTQNGSTWTLTDHNNNVETYTVSGTGIGTLQSIQARNGYTQTLSYTSGQLTSVTDSYGRSLNLTYSNGLLDTLSTPDGLVLTYGFGSANGNNLLTSVSYSTSPETSISYQYGNSTFPLLLTGAVDENGNQFRSWSYDGQGRGISSQSGGTLGADATTVAYNSNGTTTVTNALGVSDTYTFTTLQNVPKVTGVSRAATSTTAAASESFSYDTNGYLASRTDWNGNTTNYTNDSHGDPTTINEAVGSSVARTTTIAYGAPSGACTTFVQLPCTITTPGLTSAFTYDGSGNPLTRTDTDTTTNTSPYSTNGQTRTTQWTWDSTGEELTTQLPRTDVTAKTTFTYTNGALATITDALSHVTSITATTGGGLPTSITDPNGVVTTFTYDTRQQPLTATVHTSGGNLTTTYTRDAAEQLTALQRPDNSKLTYAYDAAHREITTTDLFGNTINLTRDALGDVTALAIKDGTSTTQKSHSATFDALGRMLTDVGGVAGETTTYTYDNNGNALTVTPPSPQGTTTYTYDALNRLATKVDPTPGGTTTYSYDAHNRLTNLQDPLSHSTAYTRDGWGEITQIHSPDATNSVLYYNPDGDMTQRSLTYNYKTQTTYDALDRPTQVSYPNDWQEGYSLTYDQSGHGFGVGRLTSASGPYMGTMSLSYDERGNILTDQRTYGSNVLTTTTAYNAADRITGITYPSGLVVDYTRDSMGRVTSIPITPPVTGGLPTVLGSITYEPFGPITGGFTSTNLITKTYSYDQDYRPVHLKDYYYGAGILDLAYTYNPDSSVASITDALSAANSQTLTYDAMGHLSTATSGTGGYGNYAWTWDANSNLSVQTIGSQYTTFYKNSGTNTYGDFICCGSTTNMNYDNHGNELSLTQGSTTLDSYTHNQANHLSSATGSLGGSASYYYDPYGTRIEKAVTGSNPVYYTYMPPTTATPLYMAPDAVAGLQRNSYRPILSENDLHSGQRADYIYLDPGIDNRPIAEVDPANGNIYVTATDALGTVNKLTGPGSSHSVVWSATYNPFGDTSSFSGTLTNQSLRLPGQYFDPESGLNNNGFRYYAGTLTRYIEYDPIGMQAGTNPYQYAKGNPQKYTDRLGLDPNSSGGSSGKFLTYPNGNPVIDPNTGNPYPQPPGMDIQNNLANAQGAGYGSMLLWFLQGGTQDYQRPDGFVGVAMCSNNFVKQYTDVSAYNYGAVAAAAGLSQTDTLTYAGLYNQWFGNTTATNAAGLTPQRWSSITQGWGDQSSGRWNGPNQ